MTSSFIESAVRARRPGLERAYRWASVFTDPVRILGTPTGVYRYIRDWRAYRSLPGAEPLRLREAYPCVHDWTEHTPIDSHYFYQAVWAQRTLFERRPALHIDVGSQLQFVGALAAALEVVFVDLRPALVSVAGLHQVAADALSLPFADRSLRSLSCLHVAEHIGLGRYGDVLNPHGSKAVCAELDRVLAPGGMLLFSVPVGRSRVCFNAHRIHDATTVASMFPNLVLEQFALVDDDGTFHANADPADAAHNNYSCGLFAFSRR